MFHIKQLELVHWDYWKRFTLPLDAQIVTIVGPNGSGKTTLLDALRTLFALPCSGKRDYKRYVRRSGEAFAWLRAVVENHRGDNGWRPFWPPIHEDQVTLACRLTKQGGEWTREYVIAPGDTPIEVLQESDHWVGVRDYQRRLDNAGLSAAITKVLALEQGDTDKLCEYSPKALLELVFDVFGDKEVLDQYTQAKNEQREAQREMESLELDLAKLQNQVETKISEANRYLQWRSRRDEQARLTSEIIPRLELAELRESIAGGRNQLAGNRHALREKEMQRKALTEAVATQERALADATEAEKSAEDNERKVQEIFQQARLAEQQTSHLLKEETKLKALVESSKQTDVAQAAEALQRDEAALSMARFETDRAGKRLKEVGQELTQLKQGGGMPLEGVVRAFRSALDGASIDHVLLPEIVEITDQSWQGAVEAMLRAYRHIVLLRNPSDRAHAYALGEKLQYRHFIVADRDAPLQPTPGSLLEIVRFTATAPMWLMESLNRVQRVEDTAAGAALPKHQDWITRQGFHKERRGGRHAGVSPSEFQFGEGGRRARLIALQEEAQALQERVETQNRAITKLSEAVAHGRSLVMGVDAAQLLAARAEEFRAAAEALPAVQEQVRSAGEAMGAAMETTKQTRDTRRKTELEHQRARNELLQLERSLTGTHSSMHELRAEQIKRIEQYRTKRRKMPAHWYSRTGLRALSDEFGKAADARRQLERIERELEEETWITDETVLVLRDKLEQDLRGREAEVKKRSLEYERASRLTDGARGEYINVLRATIRRYAKNVRSLGELAGIEVQCEMPHLENEDLILNQAGLAVNFSFDRKGMTGLNDGEASGGQQVMKSLIMLIGLMMDESRPGGFVFIDEPFAHLDIFNIDRVGAFLQATRAQYLITTPNTHNVNVFGPSELTLVTRKKQPQESWAQPVAVARRQKTTAHA